MDARGLQGLLGVGSLVGGLTLLTLARPLCRALGLRHPACVRALGVRDLVIGRALLSERSARGWLLARTAGDALDGALLALRPTPARAAVALGAAVLVLVDLLAVSHAPR